MTCGTNAPGLVQMPVDAGRATLSTVFQSTTQTPDISRQIPSPPMSAAPSPQPPSNLKLLLIGNSSVGEYC